MALAYPLASFLFPGCGYSLKHRLKESFLNPRGIYIPVFDNRTFETGAERVFTNALIRELESRHEVVLSNTAEGALELKGTLDDISISPTGHTESPFGGLQDYKRLPTEYGVRVSLSIVLRDPKSGTVHWSKGFSGFRRVNGSVDRTFDSQVPSSLGLRTHSINQSVFPDIASDIMRDLYDEMVELF